MKTHPLLIAEESVSFLPSLAKLLGLHEAIVVQQLHLHLRTVGRDIDGIFWAINPVPIWHRERLIWMSESLIRRTLTALEERRLVRSRQGSTRATDAYTLDYDQLNALFDSPSDSALPFLPSDDQQQPKQPATRDDVVEKRRKAIIKLYAGTKEAQYADGLLGYKVPDAGVMARYAATLAKDGWTDEQIVGCYQSLQKQPFYRDKHISLGKIHQVIGAWAKVNKRTNTQVEYQPMGLMVEEE